MIKDTSILNNIKDYEAFVYKYTMFNPEDNEYYYYGGRKHSKYDDSYAHSSEMADFAEISSKCTDKKYEIVFAGTHEEAALKEHELLMSNDAAKSPYWFNQTNGAGGLYGKSNAKLFFLNMFSAYIAKLLEEYKTCNKDDLDYGISYIQLLKSKIEKIVYSGNLFQTRGVLTDPDHVKEIVHSIDLKQDNNPDDWEPLVVLLDAKIVDGEIVFSKGDIAVISGNHRSKGLANSQMGVGLNAYAIPPSVWKKKLVSGKNQWGVRTLSDRLNPDPVKTKLQVDAEDFAQSAIKFCEEMNLYVTSPDGTTQVPDVNHPLVISEMTDQWKLSYQRKKTVLKECRKIIDGIVLKNQGENIVNFSKGSLKTNPLLEKAYESFVEELLESYDKVVKISAEALNFDKISRVWWDKETGLSGGKCAILIYYKTPSSKLDKDVIDLNNKLKAQLKRYKCPEEEYTIFDLPCETSELRFHSIGTRWEKLKEEYAQKTTD